MTINWLLFSLLLILILTASQVLVQYNLALRINQYIEVDPVIGNITDQDRQKSVSAHVGNIVQQDFSNLISRGRWVIILLLAGLALCWAIAQGKTGEELALCLGLSIAWTIICLLILKTNYSIPATTVIALLQMTNITTILRSYLLLKKENQSLKKENQSLQYLTIHDELTQIPNRRRFDQYFLQEWKRMSREKSYLSLIICDVDFFKLYNDNYGHQAGDLCLKKVAQGISQSIKRPGDLAARYGGEEFVVVLPQTSIEGAIYLANKIRYQIQSLKISHRASPVSEYVTVSLGVACTIPTHDLRHALFLKSADEALYQAKKQGRDRYHIAPDLS